MTTTEMWTRIFGALLGLLAMCLLPAKNLRAQTPTPCRAFLEATQWKGTFTLQGSGSGTLPDGGSYSINETITATPLLSSGQIPTSWGGPLNETIHVDDMESHPDGTFTHITDDETVTTGPIGKQAGFPGASLGVDVIGCIYEFDFDPSFNATVANQNGTQMGFSSLGFIGAYKIGTVSVDSGAIVAPLPTSGLVLSGSVSVSAGSLTVGDPGTWTLS